MKWFRFSLIICCLVSFFTAYAKEKGVQQTNDFRSRLKELEISVYREDPDLGREIDQVKTEIKDMISKIGFHCRMSGATVSCHRLLNAILRIEVEDFQYRVVGDDRIYIYILPTDLSLGSVPRMAVNSKLFRTVLIDLKAWRDLGSQSQSKYLLLFMEIARFMNFESEEQRYLAAGEVLEMIQKGEDADLIQRMKVSAPVFIEDSAELNGLDMSSNERFVGTAIKQDGKVFFSFSNGPAASTALYVVNPKATPLQPACFEKGSPAFYSRNMFLDHRFLDPGQEALQLCLKMMMRSERRLSVFSLYIAPKIGLIHDCVGLQR